MILTVVLLGSLVSAEQTLLSSKLEVGFRHSKVERNTPADCGVYLDRLYSLRQLGYKLNQAEISVRSL